MERKVDYRVSDVTEVEQVSARIFDEQFEAVFNRAQNLAENQSAIAFKAAVEDVVVGVISGKVTFNHLHISALAVDAAFRGHDIGTQLLEMLERTATEQGITTITLSTKSFQAKNFYLKKGYELMAELEDVPFAGVTKHYFVKRLYGTINR